MSSSKKKAKFLSDVGFHESRTIYAHAHHAADRHMLYLTQTDPSHRVHDFQRSVRPFKVVHVFNDERMSLALHMEFERSVKAHIVCGQERFAETLQRSTPSPRKHNHRE